MNRWTEDRKTGTEGIGRQRVRGMARQGGWGWSGSGAGVRQTELGREKSDWYGSWQTGCA